VKAKVLGPPLFPLFVSVPDREGKNQKCKLPIWKKECGRKNSRLGRVGLGPKNKYSSSLQGLAFWSREWVVKGPPPQKKKTKPNQADVRSVDENPNFGGCGGGGWPVSLYYNEKNFGSIKCRFFWVVPVAVRSTPPAENFLR
jgi:hypothetical protein